MSAAARLPDIGRFRNGKRIKFSALGTAAAQIWLHPGLLASRGQVIRIVHISPSVAAYFNARPTRQPDKPRPTDAPINTKAQPYHCENSLPYAAFRAEAGLRGFHLYGTDLCLKARCDGRSAWMIDFHLRHLSAGQVDAAFLAAQQAFLAHYDQILKKPWNIRTTCTQLILGGH